MKILNQKGTVLLFAVVAMTVISVLGTGIYFLTTTSTFSGLDANAQNRAYQLAVAGRDYALIKNLPNASGRNFVLANNDKFQLDISGNNIDSTGIVNEGTPFEAKRKISITKSGFSSQADISFAKDIAAFPQIPTTAQAGFVIVDPTAAQISLGQSLASKFGSVWYSGTSALGNCQSGKCYFGTGFRTYFMFKLARLGTDIPHGFTFAVFNGTDNSNTSAGGDSGMPELLAYGGNSCTSGDGTQCFDSYLDAVGKGIHPPKMAIEFDGRRNAGGSTGVCPPLGGGNSDSREDAVRTHMAYVFWGDNTTACANRGNSLTYDDNRHGAGAAADPVNAISTDLSDTTDYFTGLTSAWAADWLYNTTNVYAMRIEVTRASTMNTNSKYFYTINTWIKRCSSVNISDPTSCSEFADYSNTKVAYNPTPADSPTLKRTIELDPTFHSKFNTFLFGWTAAAGSASRENLALSNFQMYFAREPVACGGYGVWNNLEGPGTTRYFAINGIGCVAILNGSKIGNIGPNGKIIGYTNTFCTTATTPSELTYSQAATADADTDCAVYFSGADK
ncbi:MAG: hypothetical protein ABIJ25_05650 [Pseudomonadota bacterium]